MWFVYNILLYDIMNQQFIVEIQSFPDNPLLLNYLFIHDEFLTLSPYVDIIILILSNNLLKEQKSIFS